MTPFNSWGVALATASACDTAQCGCGQRACHPQAPRSSAARCMGLQLVFDTLCINLALPVMRRLFLPTPLLQGVGVDGQHGEDVCSPCWLRMCTCNTK